MSEPVTFWYGCNVLRHGDIIHACIELLRALGFEPHPVGGPDYCCGTVKDGNQTTAGGMATRTVGKLNERAAPVVAWCPSCHSHMHDFMEHAADRRFDMRYLVELLHARRQDLQPLLVHRVPMRVFVHQHVGFNELVPVNRMVPELLAMIPGIEVVDAGYLGPDPRVVPAIVERYAEAVRGIPAVNCDLCAYRAPWPGREDRQGQPIGVGHSHLAAEHRHRI